MCRLCVVSSRNRARTYPGHSDAGHELPAPPLHPVQVALDVDGHVAQAERPVAAVDEGLGHDADRVGEVDDPGAVGGEVARPANLTAADLAKLPRRTATTSVFPGFSLISLIA